MIHCIWINTCVFMKLCWLRVVVVQKIFIELYLHFWQHIMSDFEMQNKWSLIPFKLKVLKCICCHLIYCVFMNNHIFCVFIYVMVSSFSFKHKWNNNIPQDTLEFGSKLCTSIKQKNNKVTAQSNQSCWRFFHITTCLHNCWEVKDPVIN